VGINTEMLQTVIVYVPCILPANL